jgi:hypothetical protein
MGRQITINVPAMEDEYYPTGPASVCLEAPPQQQCCTAPKDFGKRPAATVIKVNKEKSAILFSAETGGVSGWMTHFALLQPGAGDSLTDSFPFVASISNQGSYAFLSDPAISDARIFVTADATPIPGPDESHYSDHRFIVSAYLLKTCDVLDEPHYFLQDQFMTVRKYSSDLRVDILASEKPEILRRLRLVKLESDKTRHSTSPKPKSP